MSARQNIPRQRTAAGSTSSPVPIQRTSSNPIAIAGSYSATGNGHHHLHHPSSYESYSSEDDSLHDGGTREIGLGSFTGPNDTPPGGLTVGSLPSHHRRHRHIGSAGMGGGGGSSMARSMPAPRAPFLSAREDPTDGLSNMPLMTLPESAEDGMGESSSVQYGSLRESRFQRFPSHKRTNPQPHHQNVRFAGGLPTSGNNSDTDDGDNGGGGLASSYSADSSAFYPQSLPAYMDAERDMVQRRWQQSSSKPGGGIGGGIGATLGEAKPVPHSTIGALSAQLGGIGVSSAVSVGDKGGGGIGSVVQSSSDYMMAGGREEYNVRGTMDYDGNILQRTGSGIGLGDHGLDATDEKLDDCGESPGSLTGLGVLQASRQSPGGLGLRLSDSEIEGIHESANRAARALSDAEVDTTGVMGVRQEPYSYDRGPCGGGLSDGLMIDPTNDDRPISPNNPDALGAFEFDLDM
mmetsp:Transcript_887/g.1324  ORF Transcript_887/g.1324 Transcript_887/m.1324 type:complete len:463 (-) Transcript_887:507-1895(-)